MADLPRFATSSSGASSLSTWVYLSDWILALILGLAFVFYFPRLVGFIISVILRLAIWKKFHVRVSMEAFRFSPLGGRITARNVVISTSDYTLSILRLNLTWRYWIPRMTRVSRYFEARANSADENVGISPEDNSKLPTSILLLMDGVEVFMYNHSVSYDNILEALKRSDPEKSELHFSSESLSSLKEAPESVDLTAPVSSPLLFPLNMLPIRVQIKRGAFVVGNPTTPSIVVASFKTGSALLDVARSPCLLDHYRVELENTMEKFQVSLKSNIAYEPQRYTLDSDVTAPKKKLRYSRFHHIRKIVDRIMHRNRKKNTGAHDWRGLRRYIDDFEDDKVMEISDIEEYAKYSLVVDTALTQLRYFYDKPGVYSLKTDSPPPEFGVDIIFSMATIHYGSWADRQRGPIQSMLFPPLSRDSKPSLVCRDPGAPRNYAGFNLRMFTKDEIIFRLPTRELSKDKEMLTVGNRNQKITRPFGWIELKVREKLKISFFMSSLAFTSGWPNTLSAYMDAPEVRTSVNHDLMFSADEHILDCDIGFPLQWNGKCMWKFNNKTKNGRFFFLREHIFLVTDVVSDFGSGTPVAYEYHRKFEYQLNWVIDNYKLYFNVNDHNIINDPLDFNNNKYLCFMGDRLNVELTIPLDGPFSKSARVNFKVSTTSLDLVLDVPPWHTNSAFMKQNKKMGNSDSFELSGYYQYYNSIEVSHNNFVVINAIGDNVTLIFYGYLIRYLFIFRENYFGDFKHFRTFEEYSTGQNGSPFDSSSQLQSADYLNDPDYWKTLKTENDMDILFTFLVRNGLIVLPCQIYDHAHHIGLLFDTLDVDIHLCHFYMDLQADFSTGFGYYFEADQLKDKNLIWDIPRYKEMTEERNPDILIDGFSVHTHRMFGLAPDLLTYHCKWDFASGFIKIEGQPACLTGLKSVLSDFGLGFKDLENTLIYEVPIVYDMANFTFRCPEIILKLATGIPSTYLEANLSDLLVGFNDIANERYSSRVTVSIPCIVVKVIDESKPSKYDATLRTSLTLTNICQKAKMLEHRRIQQQYVRQSDAPTHRVPFLLFDQNRDEVYMDALGSLFPSVSLPNGSFPLTREYHAVHSDKESSIDLDDDSCLYESDDGNEMNPTTRYYDDDYTPRTPYLPGYKHDTLILEFGAIEGFITPHGTTALVSLTTGFQYLDLHFLIDRLQVETVKQLKMLIMHVSMIDNIRFVCRSINFKIVEESLAEPDMVLCTSPTVPAVSITILEPSIAFSKMTSRSRRDFILDEKGPISYAVHIREAYVSAHEPGYFVSALTFHLSDIESWGTKSDNAGLICSTSIKKLQTTVEAARLKWVLDFLELIQASFSSSLAAMKSATEAAEVWRKELIYMLAMASEEFDFQHDIGVLTKPATILRSCEDHVRNYDSWKLMIKLRSMLDNLPSYEARRDKFMRREWCCPENSLEEVLKVFSTWRPWEANIAQRSWYLQNLFGMTESSADESFQILFRLSYVEAKIIKAGSDNDVISLHEITSCITNNSLHVLKSPFESLYSRSIKALVNIEAFDGSLSTTVLELAEIIKNASAKKMKKEVTVPAKSTTSEHGSTNDPSGLKNAFSVLLNLKLFHLRFDLPHTFLDFYTYDNMTSVEVIGGEYLGKCVNVASQSKEYSLSFGEHDHEFITLSLRGLRLVGSGLLGEKNSTSLDVQLGEIEMKVLDRNGDLCPLLERFVKEDIKVFDKFKSNVKLVSPKTERKPLSIPDFKVNFVVGETNFLIELLYPARIHSSSRHCSLGFAHENGDVLLKYSHKSVSLELGLLDTSILHYEHSGMAILSRMNMLEEMSFILSDIDLGYFKITNNMIFTSLELAFKQRANLEDRLKTLQEIFKSSSKPAEKPVEVKQEGSSLAKYFQNVAVKLNINLEYFGLSALKDRCRYTLELDSLTWVLANFDRSNLGETSPFWGELTVPAVRITILDPLFSVGLSTLLDFNFSLKVLNDNTGDELELAQSLQVESQYFRICLSPPVLFKIVELADGFTRVLKKYAPKQPAQESLILEEDEEVVSETRSEEEEGQNLTKNKFHFSSVHVLSYNFCVGWLFGSSHKDYPGFILGAERFFAVTKKDMGKLTLMEGYLSVANGSSASSFYSFLSEVDSLNRAYMAQMQLNYCISELSGLWINLIGDELDVKFMSNSIKIIERAVQSGSEVQSFFDHRSKDLLREKQRRAKFEIGDSLSSENEQKKGKKNPFNPKFSRVQMTSTFAGSKVFIYRLQEENTGDPPSLSVHSPAVLIAVYYEHQKDQTRRHAVKVELLMSPSDNTLYPSCIPVVMDFIEASKLMFRSSKPIQKPLIEDASDVQKAKSTETTESVANILSEVSFHFGFIIEKQKISLSCEPTAKVAAVVEFDGGSFHACTGMGDSNSIYIASQLSAVSASLQHIYSDERSGSFYIKSIIISSSIFMEPSIDIISSVSVNDMSAYVKMKQYQDLDLFKDIWYPKKYQTAYSEIRRASEMELPQKSPHSKFKEVSSTYAVPFALTFIVSNTSVEVDFGAALGVIFLDLDRFWVTSRKTSNWFYELQFGLQTLILGFDGRLGGYLKVEKLFVNSAIEWKFDELPYLDIPLVVFETGFEKVQMKVAFDNHVFAFANLKNWRMDAYNRKNGLNISKDHLYVVIKYDTMEVFLTSLAASDFYDIFSTISRLAEEKRTSYKEILKDSNKEHLFEEKFDPGRFLEVARKLETKIEVQTGVTTVQIYPQSLYDSRVLVISLGPSKANFLQNEYLLGITNEIELQLNNLNASLSTTVGINAEQIDEYDVDQFVEYARKCKGGHILSFPKFMISMRAYQKYESNIVEFLFQSSFGGTVDVKWNLGSVNLVREMYTAHKKAFSSRTEFKNKEVAPVKDAPEIRNAVFEADKYDDIDPLTAAENTESVNKDLVNDLMETFDKVNDSKYQYVALAPPVIEAPQLKELGNATPPLEWFGLHRNKFPNATHQFVIVTLQKLIHEIEQKYSKTLDA